MIIAPITIKKIWILSFEIEGFASVGGLGRAVARHVSGLTRRGYEVTLFIPSHGRHLSRDYVTRLGMRSISQFTPCGYRVGVDGISRRYCLSAEEFYLLGARVVAFKGLDYETGRYIDNWDIYADLPEKACLYARALLHWIDATGERPDIIHSNDWATAIAGVAAKIAFESRGYAVPHIHMIHLISSPSFPWHYASEQWCGLQNILHRVWNGYAHVKRETRDVWDSVWGNIDAFSLIEADVIASVSWGYMGEILERFGRWMAPKACVAHNSTQWSEDEVKTYAERTYGTSSRKDLRRKVIEIVNTLPQRTGWIDPGAEILLSSSGRATWQKGFDILIRSMDHLDRSFALVIMAISVGDRHFEESISRMALERWGRVAILWGDLDEMLRKTIIYASNVYAVPSRYEPFGIVSIEAQALGTPVVVTGVGGLLETIVDIHRSKKGTGIIANPDERSIADAIRSLAIASEISDTEDISLIKHIEDISVARMISNNPRAPRINTVEWVNSRFREDATISELLACYEKARQMSYYRAITP